MSNAEGTVTSSSTVKHRTARGVATLATPDLHHRFEVHMLVAEFSL